jgi:hypothetical protein
VDGLFDPDGYQSGFSDITALMVFSHQTHMINLLTRAGWEARAADPALHPSLAGATNEDTITDMLRGIAGELVDYLLFIDEAPLRSQVHGTSGFEERFSAGRPADRRGRSLYQLDLKRRLLRYPCSYLIYSPAFDALPQRMKDAVFERMWQILSGQERDPRVRSALSLSDRQAIVAILRDTKPDLPAYFQAVTK